MIRITLLEDFGGPVIIRWGYEIMVPMSFGSATPETTASFSSREEPLPARPLIWTLDWRDEETRSIVLQEDGIGVHYFGDPRSTTADHPAVRSGQVPNFNEERTRVAMVWGDYQYSDQYGPYTTVRIRVPKVPKVVIHRASANGSAMLDTAFYPLEFWKFEDLLTADHEAQYAEMLARRNRRPGAAPAPIDPSNMSDQQIDALAEALMRRRKAKVG